MFRTLLTTCAALLPLGFLLPGHCAAEPNDLEVGVPMQVEVTVLEETGAQEDAVETDESAEKLPLGINLASLHPRDTSVAFGDVFLQSSRWYPWNGDPTFGLRKRDRMALEGRGSMRKDAHGWPIIEDGKAIFTRIFEATNGRYPGGDYICSWRGSGTLSFAGDARLRDVKVEKDELGKLHRGTVRVQPGRYGIAVVIESSDPEDHIRDISLLLPGHDPEKGPFSAPFLERLEPFGVLRFMNWSSTYTNNGVWSERSQVTDCRQTGAGGVALELMIELCNQTGKDPWFCMPHLADDEFVRNFANMVRSELDPERTVYVEYSNECWNGIFPETKWVNQRAREEGVRPADIVGQETSRDFEIWGEVFGVGLGDDESEGAAQQGLVRVIGAALHNPGFARGVMKAMESDYEAIAVAPYFGVRPGKDPVDRNSTAAELLAASRVNLQEHLKPRIAEHQRLTETAAKRLGHSVSLMAYEGGQTLIARHSTTPGDARLAFPEKTIKEAQYSHEMYVLYHELFDVCRAANMELFVAFHLCGTFQSGSTFGLLEWIEQPIAQSEKYRAMLQEWADD
ncbi:MAG: hypothetical protein ACI8QS_002213 [Planctomycetota bacterium]|jgi:hypothetical protein